MICSYIELHNGSHSQIPHDDKALACHREQQCVRPPRYSRPGNQHYYKTKGILFTERSCQNKPWKVNAFLRAMTAIYIIASAGMKNRKRLEAGASSTWPWADHETKLCQAHTPGMKPLRLTAVPELLLWHWTVIKLFCVYVRDAGVTWLIMRPAKLSQEQEGGGGGDWENVLKGRFILQKSKAASFGLQESWRKNTEHHILCLSDKESGSYCQWVVTPGKKNPPKNVNGLKYVWHLSVLKPWGTHRCEPK